MDRQAALDFVHAQGNEIELARLRYMLTGERPAPDVIAQLESGQREDGGWSPFWASDYSSLDATCFRLTQAEQLGLTVREPFVRSALAFLAQRQRGDGNWEEEASMESCAPPWAMPGDLAACLYLTANCAFWLAMDADVPAAVERAADYVLQHLDSEGALPSFLHAHWLAGALWHRLRRPEATRVLSYLERRVPDMDGSDLAWLLSALLSAGVPSDASLIKKAAHRLEQQQQDDGRWLSADGPGKDVHVTLEALRVLRPWRN